MFTFWIRSTNLTWTDLDLLERTQGLILPQHCSFLVETERFSDLSPCRLRAWYCKGKVSSTQAHSLASLGEQRQSCCCNCTRIDAGKNNQSSSPYFHGEPVLNAMSQSIPAALVLLLGQLCINLLEQKKKKTKTKVNVELSIYLMGYGKGGGGGVWMCFCVAWWACLCVWITASDLCCSERVSRDQYRRGLMLAPRASELLQHHS